MTLSVFEPRCQGAVGAYGSPIARGAMPADCCQCRRRTEILPGHKHSYIQPPTWAAWQECPRRVAPIGEVVEDAA